MKVQMLAAAKAELADAQAYYEHERPGLGRAFVREVRATARKIGQNSDFGSEIEPGVRCGQTKRFPYGLVYVVRDSTITVVAVMHLHREPGYWRHRMS